MPSFINDRLENPSFVEGDVPANVSDENKEEIGDILGVPYGEQGKAAAQELDPNGPNPNLEDIIDAMSESDASANMEAATNILADPGLDNDTAIKAVDHLQVAKPDVSPERAIRDGKTQLVGLSGVAPYNADAWRNTLGYIGEEANYVDIAADIVKDTMDKHAEELWGGWENFATGALPDVVGLLVSPGAETEMMYKVLNDTWPDKVSLMSSDLLAGEALDKIRTLYSTTPSEEKPYVAEQITNSFMENAGYTNTNALMAYLGIMATFRRDLGNTSYDEIDWDRHLGNMGTVADAVPLVYALRKLPQLMKVGSVATASDTIVDGARSLRTADGVNRKVTTNTFGRLTDKASIESDAQALANTTRTGLILSRLPAIRELPRTARPDSLNEADVVRDPEAFAAIMDLRQRQSMSRVIDQNDLNDVEAVKEAVRRHEGSAYRVNMSDLRLTDEGAEITGIYGRDAHYGFATADEAAAAGMRRFNTDTKVMYRDRNGVVQELKSHTPVAVDTTRLASQKTVGFAQRLGADGDSYKVFTDPTLRSAVAKNLAVALRKGDTGTAVEITKLSKGIVPPKYQATVDQGVLSAMQKAEVPTNTPAIQADVFKSTKANNLPQSTEFFYSTKQDYKYDELAIEADKVIFGNDVPGVLHRSLYNLSPALAEGWIDVSGRFSPEFIGRVTRANDTSKALSSYLTNIAGRNFPKLKRAEQVRVAQFLEDGNSQQKVFSLDDFMAESLSAKSYEAYVDMRTVNDALYTMLNESLTKRLVTSGQRQFITDDGTKYLGKPITSTEARSMNVGSYFDGTTGTITEGVDLRTLATQIDQGRVLIRNNTRTSVGNSATDFTLLPVNSIDSPISFQALPYRKGYVARFYENNYFVREKVSARINGRDDSYVRAINIAPTKAEAQRLANEMVAQHPDKDLFVTLDRAMEDGNMTDGYMDFVQSSGQMFTGSRGAQLGASESALAVANPLDATTRAVEAIAKRTQLEPTIQSLETQLTSVYGQWLRTDPSTGMPVPPRTKNDFIEGADITGTQMNSAIEVQRYLDSLRATKDDFPRKVWKAGVIKLAEAISGSATTGTGFKTRQVLSEAVMGAYRKDPATVLKGIAFNTFIALNPIRQWALQPFQITFLTGLDPAYTATGRLAKDSMALSWGRGNSKAAAKVMGIPEKDYLKLRQGMDDSGILEVDQITYAQEGIKALGKTWVDPRASRLTKVSTSVGNALVNTLKAPAVFGRKVGFDPAERANLTMTYSLAWKRYRDKFGDKWKTKGGLDQIAMDARELSLNFSQTGNFSYQRGSLSLPLQFLSFQHKITMAMAPQFMGGSKAFSAAEKSRVAAGMFALYGAAGVPGGMLMYDWLQKETGIRVEGPTRALMDGVILETLVNNMLSTVDPDTSIDFQAMSPAGGVQDSMINLVHAGLTSNILDFALGPSADAVGKITDALSLVNTIKSVDTYDTEEKIIKSVEAISSISGQVSNSMKAKIMLNLGSTINSKMQPVAAANTMESLAKGLFGLKTNEEADYQKFNTLMRGRYTERAETDDMKAMTNTIYKQLLQLASDPTVNSFDSFGDIDIAVIEEWLRVKRSLLDHLDPSDQLVIEQMMLEKFDKELKDNQTDGLIGRLVDTLARGKGGTQKEDVLRKAIDMDFAPDQVDQLMKLYDITFGEK